MPNGFQNNRNISLSTQGLWNKKERKWTSTRSKKKQASKRWRKLKVSHIAIKQYTHSFPSLIFLELSLFSHEFLIHKICYYTFHLSQFSQQISSSFFFLISKRFSQNIIHITLVSRARNKDFLFVGLKKKYNIHLLFITLLCCCLVPFYCVKKMFLIWLLLFVWVLCWWGEGEEGVRDKFCGRKRIPYFLMY